MREVRAYFSGHFTDLERDEQGLIKVALTRVLGAINRDGGGM
jgi:hypothetical protein